MIADTSNVEEKYWKEEIAQNPEVEISAVVPFKNWMVFQERHVLQHKIRIVKSKSTSLATHLVSHISVAKSFGLADVEHVFDDEQRASQSDNFQVCKLSDVLGHPTREHT